MTFILEKKEKISAYLQYLYPVILFLYPFRHIRYGAEWWDTGYNYGNFMYIDHMDEMWKFSTYLGNAVGSLMTKLPFGDTMVGMNFYTGIFVSIMGLCSYYFFTKCVNLPKWIVFLGEFLAVSLCWCPTALLYNYLTYTFMCVACILLYQALMSEQKKSRIYFVTAGMCLGINVFARFSNLAQVGFIAAVWAMAIIRREKFRKVVVQTLWCILGYILGLGGGFAWIAIRYGAENYVQAIIRLLTMPSEASDYTIYSMIMGQVWNYEQNLIWLSYFFVAAMIGILVYLLFPKKIKWLAKVGYIGVVILLFYYLHNQMMFNMLYTTKECVFQWAVCLVTVNMIIGAIVIFSRKFSDQEKLLSGMSILIAVITPLGSNNHLYGTINNLFLVAPLTLWMIYRFLKQLPEEIFIFDLLRKKQTVEEIHTDDLFEKKLPVIKFFSKISLGFYPVKAMCMCMLAMLFVQATVFGWVYVFSEAGGGKNLHTKIENSDILKGMLTSPDRAEAISGVAAYVNGNDLKRKEVILYGNIPAMSYYLEMPFAITAWPDLRSYNYEIMKQDLEALALQAAAGDKELPVILLEISQGSYLLKGKTGLEALAMDAGKITEIESDKKLQLLKAFMEDYHYQKVFENTKFVMFQAIAERSE